MAAVQLSYRATEYDLVNKSSREVMLIGEAFITGLTIGGGPIIPSQPPQVNPPPQVQHPIVLPGDPSWGPPPDRPKPPDPVTPPVQWKPIWAGPEHGWVVVGVIDPSVPHPVPSGS